MAIASTLATGSRLELQVQLTEPAGGQVVITVLGTLNVLTNPRLRECLRALAGRRDLQVIVDLSGATCRDSSALVTLHAAARQLHESGNQLVLRGLAEPVRRAFARAGLTAMLARCAA